MSRGHVGIGFCNLKNSVNLGTLYRTAYCLGVNYIFIVGKPYKTQKSDTPKAWRTIPLFEYRDFEHFRETLPKETYLIGVEKEAGPLHKTELKSFVHPERCCYLLGNEVIGLSQDQLRACHHIVYIEGKFSLNVSVVGSIVLYDRIFKQHAIGVTDEISYKKVVGHPQVVNIPLTG
jgi:tRNA G18 (ribose-2'-O)-methylase SpoU